MKYLLSILIFIICVNNLAGQDRINKNSIYVPLIQLQPSTTDWYFNLDPIFTIGLGYERFVGKNLSISSEVFYIGGRLSHAGIDSGGAGPMDEWNVKFGLNYNLQFKQRWDWVSRIQFVRETRSVKSGAYHYVDSRTRDDWYSNRKMQGIEVNTGFQFHIFESFKIYSLLGLQIGKIEEETLFQERRIYVWGILPILENIGLKYSF